MASRQYDLVHLGATGYTGKYTLPHICKLFPTNLKWAIAGRSQAKLQTVVDDLRQQYPDRTPPAIEVCQQNDAELDQLAARTKVIISTVGPFHRYGEPVIKACANHGTSYIDSTGEVPWVKLMVDKYHAKAQSTGAIIVPQCGLESALSDLFAYALVARVRERFDSETKSITSVLWDIKMAPSGGTLATVLSLFDSFSPMQLVNSMKPYSLSPVPRSAETYPARDGLGLLTGMKQVPILGRVVNSGPIMGVTNAAIVWRTWGLLQQAASNRAPSAARATRSATAKEGLHYGPDFHYSEVRKANGFIFGFLYNLTVSILPMFVLVPPIRWLLKRLVFQPGQGPSEASTKKDRMEYRAVAEPATPSSGGPKKYVLGHLEWEGGAYDVTGIFCAMGAKVALQIMNEKAGIVEPSSDDAYARRHGGGVLTPACLGEGFVEGIRATPRFRIDFTEES